jgi:hypothetical protein
VSGEELCDEESCDTVGGEDIDPVDCNRIYDVI